MFIQGGKVCGFHGLIDNRKTVPLKIFHSDNKFKNGCHSPGLIVLKCVKYDLVLPNPTRSLSEKVDAIE